MINTDPWPDAVRRAEEELGYRDPGVPRTVAGVRAALRPKFLDDFLKELGTLSAGGAFEVFLDNWWTQAVVDTADDDEDREAALDFADLAVCYRILSEKNPTVPMAEVEALMNELDAAEAQ